jgi:hypothetical protein
MEAAKVVYEDRDKAEVELSRARNELQTAKDAIRIVHGLNQAEDIKEAGDE